MRLDLVRRRHRGFLGAEVFEQHAAVLEVLLGQAVAVAGCLGDRGQDDGAGLGSDHGGLDRHDPVIARVPPTPVVVMMVVVIVDPRRRPGVGVATDQLALVALGAPGVGVAADQRLLALGAPGVGIATDQLLLALCTR